MLEPSCAEGVIPLDATAGEATLVTTYHSDRPMPMDSRALGVQGGLLTVSATDASTPPAPIDILRFPAGGSPYEVVTGTRTAQRADTALFSGI